MVHAGTLTFAAAAALLAAVPVDAGLYPRGTAVTVVDGKSFDRLINQSNYTSIVEFYAPWCGHCKNLQPAYEKAAKALKGLAKVAAVDCDEEANKRFCGSMGVQGFPTLKIVRPGSKPGKPVIEDYNGARTAKGIVEAVSDKINNHVKKVEDNNLEKWLAAANETAKAILFTDKGKTSALLKAVAIDFKGSIEVAQIRNTQKASVELFGVSKYPTLVLLPGGKESQGIVYDGELKKDAIVKFLSKAATPNPDPAPVGAKKAKASKSKTTKTKESATKAAAEDTETSPADATESAEGEDANATETRKKEEPTVAPAPPIPLIDSDKELIRECLGPKTGTCILAILPKEPHNIVLKTIQTLSEIHYKNFRLGRKIFPFYALPVIVPKQVELVEKLGLSTKVDIIAINGRRGWWQRIARVGEEIEESDITEALLESWIENIKIGEGAKHKIPAGLIEEIEEEPFVPEEEPVAVPVEEPVVVSEGEPIEAEGAEKVTEPIAEEIHDEL